MQSMKFKISDNDIEINSTILGLFYNISNNNSETRKINYTETGFDILTSDNKEIELSVRSELINGESACGIALISLFDRY